MTKITYNNFEYAKKYFNFEDRMFNFDTMYIKEFDYFIYALCTYYALYKLINIIMINNIDYTKLTKDRKNYFLKNILKSIMLIFISIVSTNELFEGFYNKWNNKLLYRIAFIYSALDVLGLFMVNKLPLNSKIHHVTSFSLSVLNTYIDYNVKFYWLGLPIYCLLSSYAFTVNLFLALRLIYPVKKLKKLLKFSLYSYTILFAFNWIIQFNFIFMKMINFTLTFDFLLYIVLIVFLAIDDLELIKFLDYQLKKLS